MRTAAKLAIVFLLGSTLLPSLGGPAAATYAGANGKFAVVATTRRGADAELITMNPDGTGVTNILDPAPKDFEFGLDPITWAPDGSKIAYALCCYRGTRKIPHVARIFTVNDDGTGAAALLSARTYDSDPAWSPDGTKIAFARTTPKGSSIFTVAPDGTGLTRVLGPIRNYDYIDDLSWSPDGMKIAFARSGRRFSIVTIDADGTSATTLLSDAEQNFRQLNWTSDGARIVFARFNRRGSDIFEINADGTGLTALRNRRNMELSPTPSPDGTKIAFVRWGRRGGHSDVFLMDPDGSNVTRLAKTKRYEWVLSWLAV